MHIAQHCISLQIKKNFSLHNAQKSFSKINDFNENSNILNIAYIPLTVTNGYDILYSYQKGNTQTMKSKMIFTVCFLFKTINYKYKTKTDNGVVHYAPIVCFYFLQEMMICHKVQQLAQQRLC